MVKRAFISLLLAFYCAFYLPLSITFAQDQQPANSNKYNNDLTVYTFIQPEKLDRNLGGGYGRFLRYLRDNSDIKFKVIPSTAIRSLRGLTVNKNSCFFPIAPKAVEDRIIPQFKSGDILYSRPLDIVSGYIFQRSDTPLAQTLDDYNGKNIAAVRAVGPETLIGAKFQHVPVIDDPTAAKMLARKRIDYILGWYPDTPLIMEKINFDALAFNEKLLIAELTTHFACRDSAETKKLLAYINKQIVYLKKSGLLKYMLSKYARIIPAGGKGYHIIPNLNYNVEINYPE